jgi:Rha family phage regulatory protein
MDKLVQVTDGQIVVSTRQVAEHFDKQHKHVLSVIENLKAENSALRNMFCEHSYKVEGNNKTYPEYLMNRDGFSLLVMGFTGRKALEWKIKYIQAFNAMEEELRKPKAIPEKNSVLQSKRVEIMEINSRTRAANLLLKIAERTNIPEYKAVCNAKAAEMVAGEMILPLPVAERRTYSATEIGAMFGVSANKIGKLANKHNLKTDAYGKLFYSKSEHSVKEVETWRYYDSVIPVFEKIFGREAA